MHAFQGMVSSFSNTSGRMPLFIVLLEIFKSCDLGHDVSGVSTGFAVCLSVKF